MNCNVYLDYGCHSNLGDSMLCDITGLCSCKPHIIGGDL